jgi:8-oxo-dGTP pyrophosphatase MutT (NUDIX family)
VDDADVRQALEVLVFVRRGAEVLVVHRSPHLGAYWHSVAGGVEPGESEFEAAVRELHEETGLDAREGLVAVGHRFAYSLEEEPPERRELYPAGATHVDVECFVAVAAPGWEPVLDHEHDAYRWCTPEEARDLFFWPDVKDALSRALAT